MVIHRHSPLRQRPKRPGIPNDVAAAVILRDMAVAGGCVPKYLGAPGVCRDQWGTEHDRRERLTFGHVREHSGGMRRSEARWLVLGCWGHGVQGWELSHVVELRDYLAARG